jgi:hypothetical protein
MKYISVYYYGNEALQVNQWRYIDEISCNRTIKEVGIEKDDICLSSGLEVLEFYSMNPVISVLRYFWQIMNKNFFSQDNLTWDLGMLFALNIGMRIIGYFGLLFKCRRPTSKA